MPLWQLFSHLPVLGIDPKAVFDNHLFWQSLLEAGQSDLLIMYVVWDGSLPSPPLILQLYTDCPFLNHR